MTLTAVMTELEAAGSEQTRKTYKRHGVPEPMFGVSYAVLDKIKQRIKRDPALAAALWATGNADARVLACKIADPAAIPPAWIQQVDHKALAAAMGELAAAAPDPLALAEAWIDAPGMFQPCVGWQVVGQVAAKGKNPPEGRLAALLPRIEATIHQAPNGVKDAMNWALIAIGGCSDDLAARAIAHARRIGKVEVDHGDTACKTPDAEAYITKVRDRAARRAK
jgi:3-methyladenine DNA glycosylase AlkD